jgi:hypothetical protein
VSLPVSATKPKVLPPNLCTAYVERIGRTSLDREVEVRTIRQSAKSATKSGCGALNCDSLQGSGSGDAFPECRSTGGLVRI